MLLTVIAGLEIKCLFHLKLSQDIAKLVLRENQELVRYKYSYIYSLLTLFGANKLR